MLRRGVHADTGSWNERARYTSGFVYRVYSSECSLILLCDLSSVFFADPCHSTRCFLYAFTRESDINFLSGFDSIFDVFIPTGTSLFKVTRCILDYKPNAFITIEPFNSYKTVFFFFFFQGPVSFLSRCSRRKRFIAETISIDIICPILFRYSLYSYWNNQLVSTDNEYPNWINTNCTWTTLSKSWLVYRAVAVLFIAVNESTYIRRRH